MHPVHFEALYPDTSRSKELDEIVEFIKEGNSCQIIGMPGVGRGNLLNLLVYNKPLREKHLGHLAQWFHFVLVNFSEVRTKPLFEVTKLMFLELADSLRERNMQEEYDVVSDIFKEALSFQDELVLFQSLKKAVDYLSIEKELTIIFLFDRFETYITQVTSDFFTNLRSLRARAKYRFSTVFSLTRPLEELIEPSLIADFYEVVAGHIIYVSLSDPEGLQFRLSYLERASSKKIDETLVSKVIALTGGHGKLTKICLEKCLQQTIAATDITPTLLLSFPAVLGALQEIWSFLSPQEQEVLKDLSKTKISTPFLNAIDLTKDSQLTIPLLSTYIATQAHEQEVKIEFDATSNTIRKGIQILSDNLTSAEFRLLRLLLANEGRVVERDEIVQAVWQSNSSTSGVSEQAIDQLIFRLRKKIEADPTHPVFLQTVKGRGFKLQNN